MKPHLEQQLARHFAGAHGVISRQQALALGLSGSQVDYQLRSDRWQVAERGVYQRSGERLTAEGRLLAACLSLTPGAVVSHISAAWLWELVPGALPRVIVSVDRTARHRSSYDICKPRTLDGTERTVRRNIPVTTPVRTLCDLGEDEDLAVVEKATDVALARRLVTANALIAHLAAATGTGRRGPATLRLSLSERGVVGAPHPSVLESKVLRLLRQWGVAPRGSEVVVAGGDYRIDFLLCPGLVLEADGFAYHSSPAAKAADDHRRNRLQLEGLVVLQTNWLEVERYPERLRATVFAGLALLGEGRPGGMRRPADPRPGWPVGGQQGQ